jgi:soluble lytic murein transglycosylase-like protein
MNWANVWYLMCRETGEDIPLTLSIARIESATWEMIDERNAFVRFSPCAISPKGAMGLFQLMGPTAREIADKLDLYYDKSVPSLHDAITSISSDTLVSHARRKQLIRDLVFGHAQKHPRSIEAVTLNPVNNIKMGISYLAYLRRFDLPIEAKIGSYNVGLKGYLRGLGGREKLYFREQVLGSYEGYKNKANSARVEHVKGEFGTEVLLGIPNLQVHWLERTKGSAK